MLQATVVGNVWSTKRIDGLPSGAMLEVEVTGSGERIGSGIAGLSAKLAPVPGSAGCHRRPVVQMS